MCLIGLHISNLTNNRNNLNCLMNYVSTVQVKRNASTNWAI